MRYWMLTERGELHVRKGGIFIDWLPPIEVSRISDGGKVRPQKELFRMIKKKMLSFVGKTNANLIFTLESRIEKRLERVTF
jgi:hypothetical protein